MKSIRSKMTLTPKEKQKLAEAIIDKFCRWWADKQTEDKEEWIRRNAFSGAMKAKHDFLDYLKEEIDK